MPSVLITDSLFLPVGGEDEQRIRDAGYEPVRLDKPKASEAELVEQIAGHDGYLLGGIEEVTEPVVEAATSLKAIAFTGSGYTEFIPAWEKATARGIAISAARGENAGAVAEWTLISALALVRNIGALASPWGTSFAISRDFDSLRWVVVGYGQVGRALETRASALGITVEIAADAAADAVATADIVSVHVSKHRGTGALTAEAVAAMKPGAILVNAAFPDAIDNDALLSRVRAGELKAAVDYPLPYLGTPVGALLASNEQTGFNTAETNARVGARATTSLLNLLRDGSDADLVNPDFINGR